MIKPKIHKIKDIKFLKQEDNYLTNGTKVSGFYTNDFNAVKMDFVFPAGRAFQPKAFLSSLCNSILREGSNRHPNSAEIEEQLDYYGIFVQQKIEAYWSIYSFYIPLMYLDKALPLIHEILFDPIIDQVSIDFLKERSKAVLAKNLKKPAHLARHHAMKLLWGEKHPMGTFPDAKDLDNINRNDFLSFYENHYAESTFKIYIAGKLPITYIEKIDTLFGQHKTKELHYNKTLDLIKSKPETFVQKEEKQVQTALYWTAPCIAPGHKDYFDFKIANTIFGDYFGSRLMSNIREDKAYTYGIYSSISPKSIGSNISIKTEVGKEYLEDTICQINQEITRMQNDIISKDELDLVKNYMSGELLSVFDGVFHHASVLRYLDEMNLEFSYYTDYIKRIHSITAEEIQEAAIKHLNTESFHKVFIG